ncbi:ATP-binding cassette domain-containing protein [Spirillospora sp. NPDC127200]
MISTAGLSRSFRAPDGDEVHAVRGIGLSVARGETVAVLGPNGAGKSTLMRMLSTLLPPTGGTARVAGFDVRTQAPLVRERIGYRLLSVGTTAVLGFVLGLRALRASTD